MSEAVPTVPRPERTLHPPEEGDATPPLITLRALLLGLVTIAGTFYYIIQIAQKQGSGTYVQSQYPMSAFMPFVLWLFVNAALALILPRLSLRRGEMLTIFSMTWVVAVTPMWINFWASLVSAPSYFADEENRWADILFGHLPWQVFVPPTSRVVDNLWNGLPQGMAVPWDGWVGTVVQWLGATGAATVFGYCLLVVFRHQWQENEKLPYPLAQLPRDLTAGFEQKRRLPQIFRSKLFWIGFAVVIVPQIHNIVTYFVPGLPTFGLFWNYYRYWFDHGLVYGFIRVMPLILMVVYLCPVHILGSIVIFHGLATFKMGLIRRYGAPDVGFASTDMRLFLWTESHGALVFVGLWSVWIARRHLLGIWRQVRSGEGDKGEVASYRMALVGLVASGLYVVGWAVSMGVSLPMAVGSFGLMVIAFFVTVKMVAASGIAYLYPPRVYLKGDAFFLELVGSIYVPTRRLVPFKVFTSYAFLGHFTIPAWPAIAHHLRIFSLKRQPGWVAAVVLVSFPVGFVVALWALLDLAYTEGGAIYLWRRTTWGFNDLVHLINNPTSPSLGKWVLWWVGFLEAGVLTLLRNRFHWLPLHPIGLIVQMTHTAWWYWINFFLILIIKASLLRFGGIRAYLAGKPFFYGLGVGYVIGVVLSTIVDMIWFPTAGHRVHWW